MAGSADRELLGRNARLVTENRILRQQITGCVRLSDGERRTLAELGKKLVKPALEEVATIVTPETILAWHRKFMAKKFDGSRRREAFRRPRIDAALEAQMVCVARKNRLWGYDRIAGALAHLGYALSDYIVGDILKRHGMPPHQRVGEQPPGVSLFAGAWMCRWAWISLPPRSRPGLS